MALLVICGGGELSEGEGKEGKEKGRRHGQYRKQAAMPGAVIDKQEKKNKNKKKKTLRDGKHTKKFDKKIKK